MGSVLPSGLYGCGGNGQPCDGAGGLRASGLYGCGGNRAAVGYPVVGGCRPAHTGVGATS